MRYCYILFAIILTSYSVSSYAELKKDLTDLSQIQDKIAMEAKIAAIAGAKDLDSIDTLEVTTKELDAIFGAILRVKPDNIAKLLPKLLVLHTCIEN